MTKYREIASQRDIGKFVPILEKSRNLALVGIHGCGIRTISRYIAKNVSKGFKVIIDEDNLSLDLKKLVKLIEESDEKLLIVLPTYYQKTLEFKNEFQKLIEGYPGRKLATLIAINIEEYLNLNSTFKVSTKPITTIGIVQPRDKEEMLEILKEFDELNMPLKLKELIYKFSGGNPALMKRCCVNFITNNVVSLSDLLKDETTLIILSKIAKEYESLGEDERFKFGFTNANGSIKSKLLREYIQKLNISEDDNSVEKVLKIILNSKGKLVSLQDIDQILSNEGSFSLWNRYKVIERVREKLPAKYKLENIRNKGYRLIYGRPNKNISGKARAN